MYGRGNYIIGWPEPSVGVSSEDAVATAPGYTSSSHRNAEDIDDTIGIDLRS